MAESQSSIDLPYIEGEIVHLHPLDVRYAITKSGRVFTKASGPWREMTYGSLRGYRDVVVFGKRRYVHRLVLETFVGFRSPGQVCRHLDGNKLNNNAGNLKWGTALENKADSRIHGTIKFAIGSACGASKMSEGQVIEIRRRYANGESQQSIADDFSMSQAGIGRIVRRVVWKHI